MRELLKSVKRGPKAFFFTLADLPHRHPLAIAGLVGSLAFVLLLGGILDTRDEVSVQRTELTRIVRSASICDGASRAGSQRRARRLEHLCAHRLEVALEVCERFPNCVTAFAAILNRLDSVPRAP